MLDDVWAAVFFDHVHDVPAHAMEFAVRPDVLAVLESIGQMLRSVVLGADLELLPSHIEPPDVTARFGTYDELCCGWRQAPVYEQQP